MAAPPPSSVPRPPISLSSLPSYEKPPAPPPPVKPPVLASDILREEVAPKRPARRAIRAWLFAFAATFALGALAARPGFGGFVIPGDAAFVGAIATSALAGLVAILPLPYATRAALAAVTGLVPLALGALGLGPLAAFGAGEGGSAWQAATAIPLVTLLPAALVFRARYRAFAGARAILGVALALSVPALVLLALAAADGDAAIADRIASGAAVAAAMTALFGFMGPETSAGCSRWAALVIIAHTTRLAVAAGSAALAGNAGATTGSAAAALGELIASMLVTFALFQIAAAIWAERARQVDVHRIVGAGAPSLSGELKERE